MTRVSGEPFALPLMSDPPSAPHFAALLDLHRRIHAASGAGLPSLKERLSTRIGDAEQLDSRLRSRLIERLAALPGGDRVCHGDFHPFNVLGTAEQATVVDWLDASRGAPVADVCRTYVLVAHAAEALGRLYVDRYAAVAGIDPADIFDWLPVVAAARLSEGVPDETDRLVAWAAS